MAHAKSTDPNVFILPDLGEGVHEAELISWKVFPGDTVKEHDILAEMETDKALVEVPSPRAGTIKELHGGEGEILKVGNPLVTYEGEGGQSAGGAEPQPSGEQEAAQSSSDADAGTVVGAVESSMPGLSASNGKVLAAPAVRRLARDLGVDISTVSGSGIGGRVTAKDVRAAAEGVPAERTPTGHAHRGAEAATADPSGERPAPAQPQPQPHRGASPAPPPQPPAPAQTRRPLPGMPQQPAAGYGQQPYGQPAAYGHQQGYAPQMPGWPMSQVGYPPPMMMPGYGFMPPYGVPMPMPPMGYGMPMPAQQPMAPGGGVPHAPGFTPFPSGRGVPDPAQQSGAGPAQPEAREAFKGVRRTIAQRLRESVATAVHFNVMDEADATELDALRRSIGEQTGQKLSFLPFVAAAVSRAISPLLGGRFGALNARVDDDAQEIVQHAAVHLGIATDTDSGLLVPVIPDAHALDVVALGGQIAETAQAARSRQLPRERLMGSTFTISNVGSHAGRFATPVINYPEVAILAVGKAYDGVIVRDGQPAVGKVLPLSLACDHRVVDGATGALCLAEIVRLIEDPQSLV